MARNQEKAQTMLARFLRNKIEDEMGPRKVRPALATACNDLNDAEKWRGEIVSETTRLISDIQNIGLEEHEIRELNDRINQRLRLKHHWDRRIIELGGPDYTKISSAVDRSAILGSRGYKYFGVAKDLPGVREFLEQRGQKVTDSRPNRGELFRRVDIDYFGFRDEEDGELLKVEKEAEKRMRDTEINRWKDERRERNLPTDVPTEPFLATKGKGLLFTAYVPTPSEDEIKEKLLMEKKRSLLEKYKFDVYFLVHFTVKNR